MRLFFISIISILAFFTSTSQGLHIDRVNRIKSSTVQIVTDSSAGTGFYIDSKGTIVTCLHVVINSLISDKKIQAINAEGKFIDLMLAPLTDNGARQSMAFDMCVLKPVNPIKTPTSFLKIGNPQTIKEGQEVYTCGYPFGNPIAFISRGMISSLFVNESNAYTSKSPSINIPMPRIELLLDLTSNHGNSGGALVQLGATPKDDQVIGIIDYGVTPLARDSDSLVKLYSSIPKGFTASMVDRNGKVISEYDPNTLNVLFAKSLGQISFGVNGAVSVNHLLQILKEVKKD